VKGKVESLRYFVFHQTKVKADVDHRFVQTKSARQKNIAGKYV